MKKFVYSFNEGTKDMGNLLGSKGANLAEMTRIGLPVPFGFTITTEACNKYYEDGRSVSEEITAQIYEKLAELEEVTGRKFGGAFNPLLLSVRSGSAFSMPGMMETLLNVGMNDGTVKGLIEAGCSERMAYDSYRRLIESFGSLVYNIPQLRFEEAKLEKKVKFSCSYDMELCKEALCELIDDYKHIIKEERDEEFPQDVKVQLMHVISSLLASWRNETNTLYRDVNKIAEESGMAVNVQCMVFGNSGEESGTGFAYTRDPNTGENKIFGGFLFNAQGEDVLKGERTAEDLTVLEKRLPVVYKQFSKIAKILEDYYKDMQYIEFTVENGKLYILKTRTSNRTSAAALRIAVDMKNEGLIDKKTALLRVKPSQIEILIAQAKDNEKVSRLFEDEYFVSLIKWADEEKTLKVRATVNDIYEARKAFEYGAEGIGLFRTEAVTIQSLYAKDIYEDLKDSFLKLFEITAERPVGIRLFNPVFSEQHNIDARELIKKQATAIIAAVVELKREKKLEIFPGIMIPLVGLDKEYVTVRSIVVNAINEYLSQNDEYMDYAIGPMIDVPRVALTADELVKDSDFFIFELDNLTNRTFGFSMDEPLSFITKYRESIELERDMFTGFDEKGVGRLIKNATDVGRSVKTNMKLGMCKEFGIDIDMIDFCTNYGFSHITSSPEYIPASKLAAAQAAIASK